MSNKPTDPATLRAEAEARVARRKTTLVNPQPGEDLLHELMHELKVHQIELEMQNEELRQAQVALEESRDRYVDLYEFAPVGYLTLTREGMIAEVNLTAASLMGIERKNLLKRRFAHFVAVEDRERWHRLSLHALQQEGKQSCELSLLRTDGAHIQAQLDFECRTYEAAPVLRITLAEISKISSARNQAEMLLKQSEQRYQGMLEDQTETITRFKADGTVLYVNEAYSRFFGKRSEEIVGEKWHPIAVQEDLALIQEQLDTLSPANPVVTIENRVFGADGSIRWGQFANRAYYDEQGNLTEIQSVGRDITEKKKLEETLVASEREFRLLAEAMPQIVWITRPDGSNIYCNPQWVNYTGLTLEESYGNGWNKVFHIDDQKQAWDAWQNSVKNKSFHSIEARMRRADGEYRWWLIRGVPVIDKDGKIYKWFGTCTDIHESKLTEQALEQTTIQLRELLIDYESSQEADRKAIAREVHDELGQLLSTLRLDISMIRTRFAKDNPALMELVKDATELVDLAIHGVRNVTENLRPTVLGLGVLESIKWLCDDFVTHTGVDCVLDSPDAVPVIDEKRATGIFRIVQESLTNVMRHAEEVHQVKISVALSDGNLCVEVKDDGRGFDMNDTKLQTSFGILGMRERARALNGRLDIVSVPGKGTVVTARIPLSEGADKP